MAERLTMEDVPALARHFRLQWEEAQQAWVLLYPEGMVRLSPSAAEIMRRVNGATSVGGIMEELERAFPGADLRPDVMAFLEVAYERGWIRKKGG
ncbi:MAG: pyrroloquinoline quinone biosynthesis peptide chaperone PqqD [Azospira oryzae]|uniref:PqqA binding protein n=1 Tax=Pelomicrobium methylotrophicum TaxID=2602750 RepID=A0A5C7EM85_9PROT|nr:pyrroloquinoline quinone biosynthesis peptide chaperone PqqD [Pelomicrobium methylotrophicum]PZP64756.1 MAG: pyrroloquinoline quinone biosynthesis peptide chaperone PqqD [Azospira oryzae]PZP82730.1 MAG: pyrroloquinoline quinone biosynthesis peptide chaperone PqqD [Azospira oryzae]TXF12560.1 pyrroloquinoline quinone biosynthesis peptide chaperone PqqD [Pelomicrobium methylotrophicum]